jgi:predicted nuclease with TOPRIM domain
MFKNYIIQKIRKDFTEKEKYNILMEDYFDMIRKVTHMQELQDKYEALREQHKNLQSRYTKLRNQIK